MRWMPPPDGILYAMMVCSATGGATRLRGGHGSLRRVASLGPRCAIPRSRNTSGAAVYVKPFVKRQKHGRADAEAIAEAALRPAMRFVAVKSADTQGRASSIGLEPMAP